MRQTICILCGIVFAALFFGLLGCDNDPVSTPIKQGMHLKKDSYEIQANHAIKMYHAQKMKFPDSLDEVQGIPRLPHSSWRWNYNAET